MLNVVRGTGRTFFAAGFLSAICASAYSQIDLEAKLKALPHVLEVRAIPSGASAQAYDITFEQPVDHRNPNGGPEGHVVFAWHPLQRRSIAQQVRYVSTIAQLQHSFFPIECVT